MQEGAKRQHTFAYLSRAEWHWDRALDGLGSFPPQTWPTPRTFPHISAVSSNTWPTISDEGSASGGWPLKGQSPLGTESAAGQHLRPHRGCVRRDASAAGPRWQSLCRGAKATSMRARARGPAQLALPAAAAAAHTVASGACARCTAAAAPTSATCTPPQPSCYARSLRHPSSAACDCEVHAACASACPCAIHQFETLESTGGPVGVG